MNNINTPYDDVFRTLSNDCRQLVIPLINEIFGTDYALSAPIQNGNSSAAPFAKSHLRCFSPLRGFFCS